MPNYVQLQGEARKGAFKTHVLTALRKGRKPKKAEKPKKAKKPKQPKQPKQHKKRRKRTQKRVLFARSRPTIFDQVKTKRQLAIEIIDQHRQFIEKLTKSEIKRKKQRETPKRKRRVQFLLPSEIREEERKKNTMRVLMKYNGQNAEAVAKELINNST